MEDNRLLEAQVKASENYIKQLNQEAKDMMVASEALQTKHETICTVSISLLNTLLEIVIYCVFCI